MKILKLIGSVIALALGWYGFLQLLPWLVRVFGHGWLYAVVPTLAAFLIVGSFSLLASCFK